MSLHVIITGNDLQRSVLCINERMQQVATIKCHPSFREKIVRALSIMYHRGISDVYCIEKRIVTKRMTGENIAVERAFMQSERFSRLEDSFKTIELLDWYLGEHFKSAGNVSGAVTCTECSTLQTPEGNNRCKNEQCPSHALWKEIDSSYEKPVVDSFPV